MWVEYQHLYLDEVLGFLEHTERHQVVPLVCKKYQYNRHRVLVPRFETHLGDTCTYHFNFNQGKTLIPRPSDWFHLFPHQQTCLIHTAQHHLQLWSLDLSQQIKSLTIDPHQLIASDDEIYLLRLNNKKNEYKLIRNKSSSSFALSFCPSSFKLSQGELFLVDSHYSSIRKYPSQELILDLDRVHLLYYEVTPQWIIVEVQRDKTSSPVFRIYHRKSLLLRTTFQCGSWFASNDQDQAWCANDQFIFLHQSSQKSIFYSIVHGTLQHIYHHSPCSHLVCNNVYLYAMHETHIELYHLPQGIKRKFIV